MATVLLIEDDANVSAALTRALSKAGHHVRAESTALEALRKVTADPPDVVILDLGLPDLDGADALRMLRGVSNVPVIIASARRGETDIIKLLNAGADDYVTKPFSAAHLLARIAAVLRRHESSDTAKSVLITVGPLSVDQSRHVAALDGNELELTRREFSLLTYLARHAGRVVSKQELVEQVWRQPYIGAEATVDVHVSWLRRKLGETAAKPRLLRTVRGVGIMLSDEPVTQPGHR
ncbi:response regulator transcription factor [Stackebrandtia nassauensis]|uniref:Two component transcriptional regulator, winged helix family n=1 Tax=Stackebrandtia nassauensis (strain DSM 44728 / CIP 108903 / NRRL B-16338 / NBRC 102104 / LLR-40K-21) TaxID=446470 RepID=D3PZY6_STANL|nr:response regulator transcription factor [Stackebrandtia nassauensis]ADD43673.1 two component transcriptional regulator, winged helix family [Stackebrandtia nassauensis DSM 44728]